MAETLIKLISIDSNNRVKPNNAGNFLETISSVETDVFNLGVWQSAQIVLKLELDPQPAWLNGRHWLTQGLPGEFQLLSKALQVATWWFENQFCGRCGKRTQSCSQHEYALKCPSCDLVIYPRISPCVIVLISWQDQILLARGPHFPVNRYSAIAGFIEVGESAEMALKREVMEEVGLEIDTIRYFSSQSWPFPHALMLGFFAQATHPHIKIDHQEIEDAQWFQFSALPDLPPFGSIARALIEQKRQLKA